MLVFMKKDEATRKKLHDIIDNADGRGLKILEKLMEGMKERGQWWEDEEFMKEMRERWNDYADGRTKMYSHDEAMDMLQQRLKRLKRG